MGPRVNVSALVAAEPFMLTADIPAVLASCARLMPGTDPIPLLVSKPHVRCIRGTCCAAIRGRWREFALRPGAVAASPFGQAGRQLLLLLPRTIRVQDACRIQPCLCRCKRKEEEACNVATTRVLATRPRAAQMLLSAADCGLPPAPDVEGSPTLLPSQPNS